ncbi:ribonuclease H-like domain-containing protein [Tanacetum coccineum]
MISKIERLKEYRDYKVFYLYCLEFGRYAVLVEVNMAYWKFLGVFVVSCEVQAQIRRIFLDGYGVLDVRIGFSCGSWISGDAIGDNIDLFGAGFVKLWWERCNSIMLSWLLNAMFEDLVLGQIFSDNAAEVWAKLKETYDKLDGLTPYGENLTLSAYGLSVLVLLEKISSLLSRENLPDVKDTFAIISKEESHRGIASYGSVFKPQVSSFMAKSNNWTNNENKRGDNNKFGNNVNFEPGPKQNGSKTFNANFASTSNEKGATLSFTNEQMMKLMNLINDVPSGNIQANTVLSASDFLVAYKSLAKFDIAVEKRTDDLLNVELEVYPDQAVDVLQHDLNFTKDLKVSPCNICHKAKQTREPFPLSDHQTTVIGELIHLDLWGPYKVISKDGFRYFLTIVDDYTRVVWVYLVKTKDEVYDLLPSFVLIGKSSFELVYGFKPKLSHLRSFGCLCFSSILNNSDKFSARDVKFYETVSPFKMNSYLEQNHHILEDSSDNDLNNIKFFDEHKFDSQTSSRPYDDGRGTSTPNDDGNDQPCTRSSDTSDVSEVDFETSIGDNPSSEGNVPSSSNLNSQRDLPENISQEQHSIRKSSRLVKMPAKFNDYVVGSSRKYGLEKYVILISGKVCKLNKSLYGLKQAHRQWNVKLTMALLENGFVQSNIEFLDNDDGICLSQRKYCLELLYEYGLLATKHVNTLLPENTTLKHIESDDDHLLDNIRNYQKLVGKLIYLTNTRPDISYAVHYLSQFMHAPLVSHLDAALRVLRYLKGSSRSGYCVFLGDSLVTWKSKKQSTLSRSSAEAEYRSMASATCEVIWLSNLVGDMGVKDLLPVVLYYDNSSALQIAANPVFHEKSKHFEIDVHLVREKVAS